MKKICKISNQEFIISEQELKLIKELNVGIPEISPHERMRKRNAFRNFMSLYRRPCSVSNQMIISMYSADSKFKVVNNKYWWSHDWDALDYGRDYDFNKDFFTQYQELNLQVPRLATGQLASENCDYSNFPLFSKNCYMVFGCVKNEDCLYGHIVWESSSCLDCLYVFKSEWCAYSTDLVNCYEVHFSIESYNCRESYFLFDCRNCNNCFACYNLRGKQYCIMNKQYSKDEYFKLINKYLPLTNAIINKLNQWLFNAIEHNAIHQAINGINFENCTGEHIYNSANCINSFDIKRCENSSNLYTALDCTDSSDLSFCGNKNQFCYDCLTVTNSQRVIHSHYLNDCYEVAYSEFCSNSKNIFGCNGLKNKEYCILNKQYSKEEYFQLKEKIINQMKKDNLWGNFFPAEISPFAYNEACINDYEPLSEQEALNLNYTWLKKLNEQLNNSQTKVLDTNLTCKTSGRSFKVLKQELDLLEKFKITIPENCFFVRNQERLLFRSKRKLNQKFCITCNKNILTSNQHSVHCNECYLKTLSLN